MVSARARSRVEGSLMDRFSWKSALRKNEGSFCVKYLLL